KFPVNLIAGEADRIGRRLLKQTEDLRRSVLVCTSPHYAPVAEAWPGRVVYYITDFFPAYGDDPVFIRDLELRLCRAADLICPNSQRLANYLNDQPSCPLGKICILPNATRRENLLPQPLFDRTGQVPERISNLPRPIAGVIGNLGGNTDWEFLEQTISQTPWLSWVFVGPTDESIAEANQSAARNRVMNLDDRIRFLGPQPYSELKHYARAFDVAILPYKKREPTYSGSSTRFYEHLTACRPMISTRGVYELLQKEPLLRLVDSPNEASVALEELRDRNFSDGYEALRWQAGQKNTWNERAARMRTALEEKARSEAA